jgi:flagellar assembly protein FliH
MAAPAKFLFDMDFSAPDRSRERPATPAEVAQKLAAAEARSYREGFDAGQREAKAESDRRTALALEEIQITMQAIAARFAGIETRMETEAVDVAVAVARKLCSKLISAEPLASSANASPNWCRRRISWSGSTIPFMRPRASGSSDSRRKAVSRAAL